MTRGGINLVICESRKQSKSLDSVKTEKDGTQSVTGWSVVLFRYRGQVGVTLRREAQVLPLDNGAGGTTASMGKISRNGGWFVLHAPAGNRAPSPLTNGSEI